MVIDNLNFLGIEGEIADAQARQNVGDLKSALHVIDPLLDTLMEQGNWSTIDTSHPLSPQSLNYVIRTKDYASWQTGMKVVCNAGYQARILLVGSDYNFITVSAWGQTATLENTTAAYCMICIKTSNNSALTPDQIIDAVDYSDIPVYAILPKADEEALEALATDVSNIENTLPKKFVNIPVTTDSGIYEKSGVIDTRSENYVHADVLANPGEVYCIGGYKYSQDYPEVLFYNGTSLISFSNTQSAGAFSALIITIPDGVNKMVINGNANVNIRVEKRGLDDGIGVTQYQTMVDNLGAVYDPVALTYTTGILDRWNNQAANGRKAAISVSPGEKYFLICYKYGSDYAAYYFRKNGSIVSYDNTSPNGVMRSYDFTVPDDIDELVVNTNAAYGYLAKAKTIKALPYSKWHGKKIAWFGTSIPEPSGYNPITGYPEYVGKLLGATVYNEAVGSSCARRGTRSAESANDPYGVTNMGIGALWSMGGTVAEKTDLTTNWETKWRAITGYDAAMTDAIKNKAIACSYENKLMKYINDTPVDLYVFDHGYNDWRSNSADNIANPDDPFDRSTYQGAMNTFIAAILAVNPHANIVLISHYETHREPGVIDMQESVAEYWGLPLIRICDKLGWAWNRTITSTGYWQTASGGGVWIGSGGTSTEYHLPQLHMQDGKHPNTDLSGKACMDIGNIIAAELNMLPPHNQ